MSDYLKKPLHQDDQLYFIHVPKCAGTSFISLMDECYVIDRIIPVHHDIKKLRNEITDKQLNSYHFIRGHLPYDLIIPRLQKHPRVITFLREPVVRLISNFQMRQRVSDPLVGLQSTLQSLTLEEYLDRADLVLHLANYATRLIGGRKKLDNGDFIPNLELAKERLTNFDFVGIVEDYNDSLDLFCYIYDFPPIRTNRLLNVSPNRDQRKEISSSTLEKIAEIEWADIELYKFGCELFQKQFSRMQQEQEAGIEYPQPEKVTSIADDFSLVKPGQGWHVAERHPKHDVIRWSGSEKVSHLMLNLAPDQAYEIHFHVFRSAARDVLNSLEFHVNGHKIELKSKSVGFLNGFIFTGDIPGDVISGNFLAELSFTVNRTVVATQMHDIPVFVRSNGRKLLKNIGIDVLPDQRQFGLLFNWLRVYPKKQDQNTSVT